MTVAVTSSPPKTNFTREPTESFNVLFLAARLFIGIGCDSGGDLHVVRRDLRLERLTRTLDLETNPEQERNANKGLCGRKWRAAGRGTERGCEVGGGDAGSGRGR